MHMRAGGVACRPEQPDKLPGTDRLAIANAVLREVAIEGAHVGIDPHDDV
jgi:hypothetical protein